MITYFLLTYKLCTYIATVLLQINKSVAKYIKKIYLSRECVRNVDLWVQVSVMRVGTDTFGDPIFQNGLQN